MQFFNGNQNDKLRCPYKGCEKRFDKPTDITNTSVIPRQTYYACPYCMSRLEIRTENPKDVSVKPVEYPMVLDSPAKCAHLSGLLTSPENTLTDECLVCPKALQCNYVKNS